MDAQSLALLPRKSMDWILLDVTCTGSGTYRRNPHLKWRFSNEVTAKSFFFFLIISSN
jgi:16S rRNA C967 or C1407 C5-methylase (RsmB/RsmF family)